MCYLAHCRKMMTIVVSQDGFAALHAACQEGHYHIAEMLLYAGANVELESKVRWNISLD